MTGGSFQRAHAAYEAACGEVRPGMEVSQTCGATLCVNPEHLELVQRGWGPKRYPTALLTQGGRVLTQGQVAAIFGLSKLGRPRAEIAKETKLDPAVVTAVLMGSGAAPKRSRLGKFWAVDGGGETVTAASKRR